MSFRSRKNARTDAEFMKIQDFLNESVHTVSTEKTPMQLLIPVLINGEPKKNVYEAMDLIKWFKRSNRTIVGGNIINNVRDKALCVVQVGKIGRASCRERVCQYV